MAFEKYYNDEHVDMQLKTNRLKYKTITMLGGTFIISLTSIILKEPEIMFTILPLIIAVPLVGIVGNVD